MAELAALLTSLPAGIPYKPKLVDWPSTEVSKPMKLNRRKLIMNQRRFQARRPVARKNTA